jgi:hypothetical protein
MLKKLIVGAALCLSACVTGEDTAKKTLFDHGLRDVQITGITVFACGDDNMMGRDFEATNVNGDRISGYVCCKVLFGCSVHY